MTVTEATNITKNPAPVDAICETKKRKKKPIRQAIGVLVIDKKAKRVLLISSRKREGAFVLPRGDCNEAEEPAQAALRILFEEAGVFASQVSCRVGTFTEANKKGNIVAHNWMYEVHDAMLLENWPASKQRNRKWVCVYYPGRKPVRMQPLRRHLEQQQTVQCPTWL
ncbi:hypothetical protein VTP01DRAFT_10386 [Rhizomucor pusillus]|uniref:uncharacterized protein n=1 Tax=Rhizomucor pusillus TaxID=4840 RepID=UPI003743BFA8